MNNLAAPTTATPPRLGLPQDVSLKFGLNKMLGKKALSGNVNRDGKEFAKAPGLREYIRLDRAGYEQLRSTHSKSQVDRYQRTLCDAALEGNLAKADAALRMLKKKTPRDQDVQVQIHVADNAESRCRCAEIQEGLKKLQKRGLSFGIVVTPAGPGVTAGMGGAADQAEVRGLQQAHTVANILLNKARPLEAMHAFGHSLSGYLAHIAASNSLDPLPTEINDVISRSFGGNRAWSGLGNWEKAALVKGLCDGLRRVGEHHEKASGHKGALLGVVHVAVAGQLGTIAGLRARFGDAANNGVAPQNAAGNAAAATPPVDMQKLTRASDAAQVWGKAYGKLFAADVMAWYNPPAPIRAREFFDHLDAMLDPQRFNDTQLIAVWRNSNEWTVVRDLQDSLQQTGVDATDANLATVLRGYIKGEREGMLEVEQEALHKGNAATPAEKAYRAQLGHGRIDPVPPPTAPPAPLVIPADKQKKFLDKFARLASNGRFANRIALQQHSGHSATLSEILKAAGLTRKDLMLDLANTLKAMQAVARACGLNPTPELDALLSTEETQHGADLAAFPVTPSALSDLKKERFFEALKLMASRKADLQKHSSNTWDMILHYLNITPQQIKDGDVTAYAALTNLAVTLKLDDTFSDWLLEQQRAAASAAQAAAAATAAAAAAAAANAPPASRLTAAEITAIETRGSNDADTFYTQWEADYLAGNRTLQDYQGALASFRTEHDAAITNGAGDKTVVERLKPYMPAQYAAWLNMKNPGPALTASELAECFRAYLRGARANLLQRRNTFAAQANPTQIAVWPILNAYVP